jgi:DNA-binding GntR family transcriptional regulator
MSEIDIIDSTSKISKKSSLSEYVFDTIREAILNGKYKENDLLKENALATELGVSRTPVREALKQLELEGLVLLIPNKGASVIGFSKKDVKDIYEMRALLEGLCVKKAIENINDDIINELFEILDLNSYYLSKGKMDAILELDNKYHQVIYKAANSRMISQTLSDFHHYLERMRKTTLNDIERAQKSHVEHQKIANAIKERNVEEAQRLAIEHINNSMLNIDKHGLW